MPTKKQATKKAQYEAKVKQLDKIGSNANDFITQEAFTKIENILGEFIEKIHSNINKEKDMVTTGAINDITLEGIDNQINVMANKHLIYQDRGVNGAVKKLYDTPHSYTDKMPPPSVFVEWIKRKNLNLINNHKYEYKGKGGEGSPFEHITEEDRINSIAWGIAKKIYKEGFKPRNLYSKEIPSLIEQLQKEINDFHLQSITQVVDVKESAKRIIIK